MADGYIVPTKQIVSPSDLHAWIHSDAYTLVDSFIEDLSKSVEDKPIALDLRTSQVGALQMHAHDRMLIY